MRNLLQNLLIVFALGLCVLVAAQWHREAKLNTARQTLDDEARRSGETIQSLRGDVQRAEAEILRLSKLRETDQATTAELARLKGERQRREVEFQRLTKQAEAYKTALDTANASIKQQNESITTQNEELKRLTADRNEVVLKFNQMAEQYNELVARWNALPVPAAKSVPAVKK